MNKHNKNRKFLFGFMSFPDFYSTLLGLKTPILNFLGGALTVLLKIAGIIYSSKAAVLILLLLMLLDWGTGVWKAIKLKKFNSFTFQRMLINIFFTMLVIGFAYQLSLVLPLFAWLMLPEFLLGGFAVTYFFSVFENLHQMDSKLIPVKMYNHLKSILDIDNIVKGYFKPKQQTPKPEGGKGESEDEKV